MNIKIATLRWGEGNTEKALRLTQGKNWEAKGDGGCFRQIRPNRKKSIKKNRAKGLEAPATKG